MCWSYLKMWQGSGVFESQCSDVNYWLLNAAVGSLWLWHESGEVSHFSRRKSQTTESQDGRGTIWTDSAGIAGEGWGLNPLSSLEQPPSSVARAFVVSFVTHSHSNACDTQPRILYKKLDCVSCFLVQVFSSIRILHQIEQSSIRSEKLADTWPELRDVIGWLVCWLLTICFFCLCCLRLLFIICKFLVQETCASFLYKVLDCVSPA